ncbi:MAG: DUF971 domain-containing protein [Phycisphaeraceae bacterium]|nr:DUF971 domain-containing protein [Phycisphaeraceae bacterium]
MPEPETSTDPSVPPPSDLSARTDEGVLAVTWPDGRVDELAYKPLRCACHCAHCVHEITGERLLDPDEVDEDIAIKGIEPVGRYAVRIAWSDGHDTGLWTWSRLRNLGASASDEL